MRPSPTSLSADLRRKRGFTLVEIFVALAILGLMMLTLAQIFGTTSSLWRYGQGKVNNFTKGRSMLNLLENDIHAAVFRPDMAAFPGGAFKFYTARPGVPVDSNPLRNVSLIQYSLVTGTTDGLPTSTLERYDMPVSWANSSTYLAFGNANGFSSTATGATTGTLTPRDTAPGVLAFQAVFVQANGTFSTSTFTPAFSTSGAPNANPTRSIGVTIAVIDDQALRVLSITQATSLQSSFVTALSGQSSPSVKACWEQYLKGGLTWSSYPKNLSTGMGIYECYIPLP